MQNWIRHQWRRSLRHVGWVVLGAIAVLLIRSPALRSAELALPPSQYSSTITAPFNQPTYYPIHPDPPSSLYRPVADWVGRLILPTVEQYQQVAQTHHETDWAWFEIYSAPAHAKNLIGQTVRLAWGNTAFTQKYVGLATRDIRFTPEAKKDWQTGVINPTRLNNRNQVGPLQSLAGGHPYDDVTVQLWGDVTLGQQPATGAPDLTVLETLADPKQPSIASRTILRIVREPLQNTGRFYALVKFLELVSPKDLNALPQQCPGKKPCPSDLMRVQHYNPKTHQFDGVVETIHIPQQPADKDGVFNMTTRDLPASPAGQAGWYIYGAPDHAGLFTVEALKPRSLFQLPSQQTILGLKNGLKYINYENWQDLEQQQGSIQTVLVDAQEKTSDAAQATWKVGTRALFLHNFGGRGGSHENHESYIAGTYAGHFSFGVADVVQDPFTDEPIFDLTYFQVYGNGGDGTLSGGQTWAHYMGNLRRGIMGTRPISDTLVQLETLTEPYTIDGTQLSFFNELIGELSLVGARYRIGDGSGNSTITSATSCVQDSAQALFITLHRFKDQVETKPQLIEWMRQHPDDATTLRFTQLISLGKDLADHLMPLGVVRWDWQGNADILTGVEENQQFLSIDDFQIKNLLTGLISWRTAMPRQANDELAMLFLHHGASLWVLRSTIIGGTNPDIAPLEPTLLLGAWKIPGTQVPLAAWLVIRSFGGVTIPTAQQWLITLALLLALGAIAIPIGVFQGILRWHPWHAPWYLQLGTLLRLLLVPALLQEYVFRVLLIPYPNNWLPSGFWWAWALLALGVFVGFQLLYARWSKRVATPQTAAIVSHPLSIGLLAILGIVCTIVYRLTGSLWTITLVHWVFISAWWFLGGGGPQTVLKHRDQPQIA